MKQRLAIARTLAIDPDTLLMDEPFGALDAQTRALMQEELIAIWNQSPKTVVFVTHDVREAVLLADRVAVMSARPGRLKEIVDTRFPGGLSADIAETPEFLERVKYTWNLVREEAIAAERSK
jgi:NitT/TauT family transport system ATP-binding protein